MRRALRKRWCSRWASRPRVLGFHSPEQAGGVGWGGGRITQGVKLWASCSDPPVFGPCRGWGRWVVDRCYPPFLAGAGTGWSRNLLGSPWGHPDVSQPWLECDGRPWGRARGWGEFEKETIPVSTSPALGSLRCLPPSEGLVPGGREAVFLGLCSRPSRQVSRPRTQLSTVY